MRIQISFLLVAGLAGCVVSFDESLLGAKRDGLVADLPSCPDLRCEGDQLVGCSKTLLSCSLGCSATPTPHCRTVSPSNSLPPPGRDQTGDLVVDGVHVLESCSGVLDGSAIPGTAFTVVEQTSGPRIGVLRIRAARIKPGARLLVGGTCALALIADQDLELGGMIDLRGGQNTPYLAGAGGGQGGFASVAGGCGHGESVAGVEAAGGGGGGFGSDGGRGGKAGSASGALGAACGKETIEPLAGGGGGGRGGCVAASCASGYGGGGGGALALVAGRAVKLLDGGELNVGGGGGGGGLSGASGGGGGGSGGAILIEASTVELSEKALIVAGGGGGGGIAELDASKSLGVGGVAGSKGAAGGSGVVAGGTGAAAGSAASDGVAGAAGGGGGGGRGRLRITSASGAVTVPASASASISQSKVKSE